MNEKLEKLYNLYKQNGIIQSTDFNTFSSASEEQKRKLYDLGRQKGLFNSTDYNTFSSAFKPIKKKEPSASPSAQNQKPTSSVTQETKKPKPSVSSSVGGSSKVFTGFPGKVLNEYRVVNDTWQKKEPGKDWVTIKNEGSISGLNKQFKQNVSLSDTDKANKIAQSNLKKAEAEKIMSDKEMADVFGWSEDDVKKAKKGTQNTDTDFTPAMAKPNAINPLNDKNYSTFENVVNKAAQEKSGSASGEEFNAEYEKQKTIATQKHLKSIGYDVDVNGDPNDEKTVKYLGKEEAKKKSIIDESFKASDTYDKIDNVVDKTLVTWGETPVVDVLRKNFSGDGFIFEESGIGNNVTIKYSPAPGMVTREITVPVYVDNPEESLRAIKDFMKQTYLTESERTEVNGDDVNSMDPIERAKYISRVTKLMAENPYKYGTTLFTDEEINSSINNTYNELKYQSRQLEQEYAKLKSDIDAFNDNPSDESERIRINNKMHELAVKEADMMNMYSNMESYEKSAGKIAAIEYEKKAGQGNFLGILESGFFQGLTNIEKTMLSTSMDILPYAVGEDIVDPITREKLKDDGYSDSKILDYASKQLKQDIYNDIKNNIGLVGSGMSTTEEYKTSEERNDLEKVASFLSESIATSLSGGGSSALQKFAFFTQSYNGMEEQMMGPQFDGLTEAEKKLISVPYGMVIGALERYGVASWGQGKNHLVDRLAMSVVNKTMLSLPKDASISTIKREINKRLSTMLLDGTVRVVGGSLIEGGTEGTQQLFETSEKWLVNEITGKDYFKDVPDLTTYDGVMKALDIAKTDAYYGAIGGLIMAGGSNAINVVRQNRFESKEDKKFNLFYNSLMDNSLRSTMTLGVKLDLKDGKITKEEAKQRIDAIKSSYAVASQIPGNLSIRDKRDSFNLILEKKKLEEDISKYDEALTAPERARLAEINEQLKTISQNAVQEQTTGEVSVQPETTTGQEVDGGKPEAEPQVVTKEGKEEVAIDKPTIATNATVELDRVKSVDMESEDGATFNLDGTKYEGGGLIVPVASTNTTIEEITPEMIADFVEANSGKIGDKNTVKVGIYKFPNSNKVSIDLNVVAPESSRDQAIEFGKQADQESLFDLSTFENVKTGGTGMNPMQFTDDQFKEIAKALNEGRVPNVFGQQQSAGQIDMDTTLSKIKEAAVSGNKMAGSMYKAIRSSMQAMPGVKIFVHDSKEAYQEAISRSTGQNKDQVVEDETNDRSAGTILPNGEIHIDASIADAATVYHEMFHYAAMQKGLSAADIRSIVDAVKSSTKNKELIARADEFAKQYEDKSIEDDESLTDEERDIKIKENKIEVDEEFFSELGALLTASEELLQPKNIQKFFTIINNMFKKLGLPAPFTSASTRQDAIDFINSLSKGMREGTDAGISGQSKNKTGDSKRKKQAVTIMEGKESMEKFGLSKGKNVTRKIGEALEARQRAKYGTIDQKDNSAEAKKKISNWMVDEVKYFIELMGDKSGKGWYGELYQKSLDAMSKVFPEMKTDQNARDLFTMLVAITSDGQKVMSNFKLAAAAYDYYKKNGVMPSTLPGQRVASFEANLSRINKLLEEYNGDIASIKKGLMEVKSIEEINKERKKEGLEPLSTNWPVSFKAPFAASVFGPKLGMFYSNLSGNEAYPTLDRWWSRTFNRYRGTLIPGLKGGFNKKGEALGLDRFKQLLGNSNMSNEEALLAAKSYRDSYAAKGYKSGTDIEKAANTIYKIAFENLNDAPFTKNDRQFMYDTVSEAVNKLNKQGYELSIADVQAILWYFEKNLYKTLGVQAKIEGISYEDAANYTYDKWKEAGGKFDYKIDKSEEGQSVEDADEDIESESMTRKKRLAPKIAEKLTEDGNGNYVFQHWSSQKRDVIKPGTGQNSITGKDEASSLSAVGGLAQYYTMKDQSESGTGNVLHTVLVPMDKVYDAYNDPMGFAEEARRQFNEVRPGQGFDEGYRAAFITKVANENGYDMTVYPWRNTELRAQTTLELKPERENIDFKDRTKEEYNVGDKINVYGEDAVVTSVEGPIVSFKSETSEGSINVDRSPRSIRKKRKAPKNEAISKAKEKYDISIDRGNSVDQARKSAMSDLKKNDWYANANDIEREDAVRDLRKFFGLKEKSAPSVKKVLGKADSKTVTMNVSTLRDEFIKARGTAAKQAAKSIKDVQREIAAKIKDMVKSGKVSAKQAAILTDRLARLNTENPLMVERYLAYAEKVFENADYAQRLSDAFSIRKKIKRLSKSPNNQAEVRAMGKAFLEIDPSMVDDIDVYNEMAQMIFDALKPSRVSGTDAIYKSAALIEDVNIYTNEMVSMQEDKKKDEMLNLYSELVSAGVLSEDMSMKDIQTIVQSIENDEDVSKKDEKAVRDYNKNTFGMLSSIVRDAMDTGVDPITGESVDWDEKATDLIKRLMNIDMDRLSVREGFMAIEALQNFMVNGITSGVEATVYAYDGALNAEKAANEGIKARDIRVYLSKMAGRIMSANFATIPVLFDSMFGGVRNGGRVMEAMGLSKYSNGVAKATKVMNNIVNEYGKAFSKKKPNGESFNSANNVYERGMLAFLKRTVMGSDTEMNEELARRINLLRDSIKELRKGGDSDMKKADIYEELFSKLGLDQEGISIIDIESRVDKINRDAVDWWIGKWSEHYPDLYDVSLSVFNTQLGKDLNYTPDRFSRTETSEVMSKTEQEEMLAKAGAFSINMDFTDKNKSGVLMEATRPKKTPGRYVDLDFDMSNSNAMKAALIDINTAGVVRQIDSFLRSDAFKSMIPNKKDYTLLRGRVNSYIRRTKGKDAISNDSLRELNKVTNALAGLGSTKALGGILQPIKQTLPVIMNTLINAGRFNPMSVMDKGYNEWLDNSGMSIANRGLESSASIDTANKYLDKAADGGVETVLKYANKLNEMWLKVFLSKPDVVVARASFQAYYKQDLKRQGISTDIDWTNHEINQEAANYAQHMVDRQQNVSDAAMGGEFMASNDTTKKLVRKVAMPFANFVMNQKNRMYSDIRTLQNGMATKEDKRTAGRSLIGLTVEMISYQVITYAIGRYIASKAAEIAGYIPGDDDEEKQEKYAMQRVVSQGAKDFLSPIPLFDGATLAAFNYVADKVQDVANWAKGDSQGLNDAIAMKNASLDEPMTGKDLERFKEKWLEEKKWKFEDFQAQSTFGFDLGTLTIVLDKLEALKELATVAKTGEFIKEYNGIETKQYLMEEDRSILKPMVAVEALHILGALPVEASSITRNVEKFVKKKGITEAQKDKYDLVKKKYGKVEPWMMEIVKSKKREDGTIQEIEWVKSFGDLNEKQGSKYVEIFKKREGQVTYDDMMRISKMK